MAIDDKIRNEKLQYDINREAAKTSALLPSDKRRVTEQAKFTLSFKKSFRKTSKNN